MKTTETEITEFKGSPVFNIHRIKDGQRTDRFSLVIGFGVSKAKAILDNVEEIKKFVAENGHD